MEPIITEEIIARYAAALRQQEKSAGTIEKYLHTLRAFSDWMGGRPVSKEEILLWKDCQRQTGKTASTINGSLAALHSFFCFCGWEGFRVKYLKIQRRIFRDAGRELSKGEYVKLVEKARHQKKERLALLLETICGTGIRVSEVKYITAEAVRRGRAEIFMKSKVRSILIPKSLAQKLKKYMQTQKITSGELFLTANGKSLTRGQIWVEMKRLSKAAAVAHSKVFPHNLRHLFARTFYQATRDIVMLSDVLGHSTIETTRIYLASTGTEHARQLDKLGLIDHLT